MSEDITFMYYLIVVCERIKLSDDFEEAAIVSIYNSKVDRAD